MVTLVSISVSLQGVHPSVNNVFIIFCKKIFISELLRNSRRIINHLLIMIQYDHSNISFCSALTGFCWSCSSWLLVGPCLPHLYTIIERWNILARLPASRKCNFVCLRRYFSMWLLFTHYITILSSLCRRIWRYRPSKMLVGYILSIIVHASFGAVCVQLNHFCYDDCENTCILSYHHQIGSMTHFPLFRVRSWNNAVSLNILIEVLRKVIFSLIWITI